MSEIFYFLDLQNSKTPGRNVACSRFLQRRNVLNLQWGSDVPGRWHGVKGAHCSLNWQNPAFTSGSRYPVGLALYQWTGFPRTTNRCVPSFETERLTVFLSAQASGQHRFENTKRLITSFLAKQRNLECPALAKSIDFEQVGANSILTSGWTED